jgi:sugar lactone lactonase YvrE
MKAFKNKNWQWIFLLTIICYLFNTGSAQAVSEALVPPSPFKGLNGLNFDNKGQLYVGSLADQTIYRVDVVTGEYEVFIDRPDGQADDLVLTRNGKIFYTNVLSGEVRTLDPETGKIKAIASGISVVNPIAQNESGRLFVAQSVIPPYDGLYEIDPTGLTPPRLIRNNPAKSLNAFDFGPDGLLYAPVQFTGEVVKINVDTGASEQVVSGLSNLSSVKFNSKGELFVQEYITGRILQVDTTTGQIQSTIHLPPGLDNMAFGPNDLLYVTSYLDSILYEVNTEIRSLRKVLESGGLTAPSGIAVYNDDLYVADLYSYRVVDRKTGLVKQTLGGLTTPIQFAQNVSVNDQNTIISSWFSGLVHRVSRETGNVLNTYTGFGTPYDAVELSDGSILVADCALGQITQILHEAGTRRRTVAEGLSCPTGLALVDDSSVLVTEYLGNQLLRINLATGERQVIAEDLSFPEGVAYHPDGIAVVADTGTQSVRAIDIGTGKSLTLKENLPIGLPGFLNGQPPYFLTGIAIADDTVYITGDVDNSIRTVKLDSKRFAIPEASSQAGFMSWSKNY